MRRRRALTLARKAFPGQATMGANHGDRPEFRDHLWTIANWRRSGIHQEPPRHESIDFKQHRQAFPLPADGNKTSCSDPTAIPLASPAGRAENTFRAIDRRPARSFTK